MKNGPLFHWVDLNIETSTYEFTLRKTAHAEYHVLPKKSLTYVLTSDKLVPVASDFGFPS